MTAELLAQNVVAHWLQAAGVAGAAWLGVHASAGAGGSNFRR